MLRKIIEINAEDCNGCGICVDACHEGALQMINGKAVLVSESYCDGLGDCLPECPTGAITIIEREAEPFDEEAVKLRMAAIAEGLDPDCATGCAAANLPKLNSAQSAQTVTVSPQEEEQRNSELAQWPCQLKLMPVNAPYLQNAHLLLAADCTAFAYADFHRDYMKNKITIIACPKLDMVDYSEKLTAILRQNEIKSLTVVKMEVPCCNGLLAAAKRALLTSGKLIPWQHITISTDGKVIED